ARLPRPVRARACSDLTQPAEAQRVPSHTPEPCAVNVSPWLAQRPWLIGGAALLLAVGFQLSKLKDRCLRECRRREAFLLGRYGRGLRAAFRVGREHGLFCLGCCWAPMLLMFAAGVANPAWMGALTLVMVVEQTAPTGQRVVPLLGIALAVLGAVVLAQPPGPAALFAPR